MQLTSTYDPPQVWVAEQLAALPTTGLRRALVLTAHERLAHSIRHEVCISRGRPDLTAGVTFLRPAALARQVLARAGLARKLGWESLRAARILQSRHDDSWPEKLEYFDRTQLQRGAGYVDALIEAIGELECGGLTPDMLDSAARQLADDQRTAARLRDLATIWRHADQSQKDVATTAQVLTAATALLRAQARPRTTREAPTGRQLSLFGSPGQPKTRANPLPPELPIFAVLEATPNAVTLRFLQSLPQVFVVFQDARPVRTGAHRWRTAAGVRPATPPAPTDETEVAVGRRFLFETPECLADPTRLRSAGPDGSVTFEEHAGVEDEIEAAATWVTGQVASGVPLEQIAVLIPDKGAYATLLLDRMGRAAGTYRKGIPTFVAGGIAAAQSTAGSRIQLVLDAVAEGLAWPPTLRVIPHLRRSGQPRTITEARLSPSRAAQIVIEAGVAGGGRGDADAGRDWSTRLHTHRVRLAASIDATEPSGRLARVRRHQAQRWLRDVEPMLPAIDALVALADLVATRAPLRPLWEALAEFCRLHLLLPADADGLLVRLDTALQPAFVDPIACELRGDNAIRWLQRHLRTERIPCGRFGEPRVFVGTPAQAAGLSFAAVRLVGLAEGGQPRTAHDDPIVPDAIRARIDAGMQRLDLDAIVPRLADSVLDDLHAVFRAVSGARVALALSVPRQWVDRSDREVSGIVLEMATALGRPGAGDGDVPTAGRLRTAYFATGAALQRTTRAQWPLAHRSLLSDTDTRMVGGLPARWFTPGPLSLARLREIKAGASSEPLRAIDGVLGPIWQQVPTLGRPERALSASALQLLLGCPHRFLLERVLHWQEPPRRPPTDTIEPGLYGTLFHQVAEAFFREAGPAICSRQGSLEWWVRRAQEFAATALTKACETYPLRGADAVGRERQRVFSQIAELVRDEWERPPRRYLASELSFGRDAPVALGPESLHLWGAIDRIDGLEDGSLSVRDIKTGRVRDLAEEDVNPARDLQIGIYTLVAESLFVADDGHPGRVSEAVYVHPSAAQAPERAFRGAQLTGLVTRTQAWLALATELLAAGLFVRTTDVDECRTCPFVPVCGDGAQERSGRQMAQLPQTHPLAAFLALKRERIADD